MRTSSSKIMRIKSPGFLDILRQKGSSHQTHQHTIPKISKLARLPLCCSAAAVGSNFFSSTKSCKTPQQHVSTGNVHLSIQGTCKQPVCLLLVHLASETRDTLLLFSSIDTCQTRPLSKQRENKVNPISSCHIHTC